MKRCDDPFPPMPDAVLVALLARYAGSDPEMVVECNSALIYCLAHEVTVLRELVKQLRPIGRN